MGERSGGSAVLSQSRQIVPENPISKNPSQKRTGGVMAGRQGGGKEKTRDECYSETKKNRI
jgi:hypothetical protein